MTARPIGAPTAAMVDTAAAPDAVELPAERRRPPISAPRQRAAYTFGNYALICAALGVILFAFAMLGGAVLLVQRLGPAGGAAGRTPQVMDPHLQAIAAEHPWIFALQFGGLFFGLAGLTLGIVSLTQVSGNWRGLTAVIGCGVFLLCVCSGVALGVAMGFGAGGT